MIQLTPAEAQQILAILAQTKDFPWTVTNPLVVRLSQQLQEQPHETTARPIEQPQLNGQATA